MNAPSHETYHRAMQAALRRLRTRDRTEAELRQHLSNKGFGEPEVGLVLKSLTDQRYLDDDRLAKRAVEVAKDKPKGRLLIEHELAARGAHEEAVEGAIADLGDELQSALNALNSRKPDTPAKGAAFLQRRGFEEDTVRTALERVYGELD